MDKNRRKTERRNKIKRRIRSTIQGTAERPRLAIHKSNKHVYMQIIDDLNGVTLAAYNANKGVEPAAKAGEELAKLALDKGIENVVFDRSGYKYHGIIKAIAEGARKGGLDF